MSRSELAQNRWSLSENGLLIKEWGHGGASTPPCPRFSRNNGITEGFHREMKLIQRRAYGFHSFNNHRLRVIAQ
jgi:hypothetical protein